MKKLCILYLDTFNHTTLYAAKYYTYGGSDRFEFLGVLLDSIIAVSDRLDYSVFTFDELSKELKKIGDSGEYTFLDTYLETNNKLYEQLILYPKDELYDKRKFLYDYLRKTFNGCLHINTGGWTG